MKLATHIVEKPWGRRDIPAAFGDMGARQVGEIWYDAADGARLPLLVKWLFTSDRLSVQVHPSDVQAKERGLSSGKEECWYIVDAEPGAVIAMGAKEPLSPERLREASLSGEIEQLMDWKPVQAGDYYYIPAGTVHAIGAGITMVELQQNADITYRLYDYKRLDNGKLRELHLEDGVAVSDAQPYTDPRSGHACGNRQLVDGPHFRLWLVEDEEGLAMLPHDSALWITPISGQASVSGKPVSIGECGYADAGAALNILASGKALIAAIAD